ncbi:tyrosine-type recombinase/integrase [Methylophaga sp.]|uniref:phage integrase n=1 Tax=Methylophaga sp. TaxID=2024840 RepID=UPI002728FC69|nr:tyrosine-type recombinase/integrase [Methylophaga sp.]MDO8826803.1 tyrosine-type recombinase/integrase [Methylophaga sp.]
MDYKQKLTPSLATKLSQTKTDNHFEVTDTVISGFKLKLYTSGTMTFSLMYTAPDGRRLRYTMGNYPALSVSTARKIAEQLYAQVKLGRDPQREKQTAREVKPVPKLGDFINDTYLPWFTSHHKAPKAKLPFNQFKHLFSKRLDKVTGWDVESWRSKRHKDGLSASTSNRYIGTLKAMFNRAVEWEVIEQNPITKVKKQKSDSRAIVRYLTPEEETRLRASLRSRDRRLAEFNPFYAGGRFVILKANLGGFPDHIHPMILLLMNTGMRRGEMFNLRWQDVDFVNKRITVMGNTSKTGQTRYIPLNVEALNVLQLWQKQTERHSGFVFIGKNGQRFTNIDKAWKVLLRDAKINDFRLHDLRHHFASRLVSAGIDLNSVRELLGHSDIKMTLRYAHLAPGRLVDAVAMLNH